MTEQLPAIAAQLPPTTPLKNASRSPQEIAAHRGQISVLVETVLDGYWQNDLSQRKRDLILMDWCDELEEWPVESVKAALRNWRRDNPSKKPNPGHILQILNRAWGERNAPIVAAVLAPPTEPPKERISDEARLAILAEVGMTRAILTEIGIADPLAAATKRTPDRSK